MTTATAPRSAALRRAEAEATISEVIELLAKALLADVREQSGPTPQEIRPKARRCAAEAERT